MRKVLLQMCITLDGFADGETRIVPEFDTPFGAELEEELAKTDAASVDTPCWAAGRTRSSRTFGRPPAPTRPHRPTSSSPPAS
jgi:hypothetical protein